MVLKLVLTVKRLLIAVPTTILIIVCYTHRSTDDVRLQCRCRLNDTQDDITTMPANDNIVGHLVSQIQQELLKDGQNDSRHDSSGSLAALLGTLAIPRTPLIITNSTTVSTNSAVTNTEMLEVCPDIFGGPYFGQSSFWMTGFKSKICRAVPFESIVTILINLVDEVKQININHILDGIRTGRYQKLPIVMIVDERRQVKESDLNITYVSVNKSANLREKYEKALAAVHTKYVLVMRDVILIEQLSHLERLLQVANYGNIDIVGGSHRNVKGHWLPGCYQTTMKIYKLDMIEGYYKSEMECLYCDYTSVPFLIQSSAMSNTLLKYEFYSDTVRIFYLNLFTIMAFDNNRSNSIVACPDVMFFTETSGLVENLRSVDNETHVIDFAKGWQINSLSVSGDGEKTPTEYSFTCADIDMDCKNFAGSIARNFIMNNGERNASNVNHSGLVIPTCCYRELTDLLVNVMTILDSHSIPYQLIGGTALGACKLQRTLPWEIDHDLIIHQKSFSKLLSLTGDFKYANVHTTHIKCIPIDNCQFSNFFVVSKSNWILEIFADYNASRRDSALNYATNHLSKDIPPTRVLMDGYWAQIGTSPGFFCRNRYGNSIYGHVEHWSVTGGEHGFTEYGTGKWQKCPFGEFHGCLENNFNTDGNIQFR